MPILIPSLWWSKAMKKMMAARRKQKEGGREKMKMQMKMKMKTKIYRMRMMAKFWLEMHPE